MSEKESNSRPKKRKISRLAVASAGVGLLGISSWALFRIFWFPNSPAEEIVISFLFSFPYLAMPLALVLGVASTLYISRQEPGHNLRGRGCAVVGIAGAVFLLIVLFILPPIPTSSEYREACAAGMDTIAWELKRYAAEHDSQYPTSDKWCDLLMERDPTMEDLLCCPVQPKQGSTYAVNPNCEPNSPGDMVLLFETKGGWNQSGGPEILTTENHKGKGCNVLFNDGSVKFIRTKDLTKLKWEIKESQD
jgi:prepilin-type processing-associated H-X9-DG protein